MQIGDKVWIFDNNHRIYEDDKGNKLSGAPWYRGHFVERYILGETKQSWIIGYENDCVDYRFNLKVNKKTMIVNGHALGTKLYLSEEEINQACWMQENSYKITQRLQRCNDYNILKQVEKLLE